MKKVTFFIMWIVGITYSQSSLKILSGSINGFILSSDNYEITVEPGAEITGQIALKASNDWDTGDVVPLVGTPSWGDAQTSFWGIKSSLPTGTTIPVININLTAPTIKGVHYIYFAFSAELSYGNVMSLTNWAVGNDDWDDGVNVAHWNELEARMAIDSGYVRTRYLGSGGYSIEKVPAAVIKVNVNDINTSGFEEVFDIPWWEMEVVSPNLVWVVDGNYNAVKINLQTDETVDQLNFKITPNSSLGGEGRGITWDGNSFWYSEWGNDKIYKLNANTGEVIQSFNSPGSGPQGLAWDGEYLWSTDEYSNKYYKLSPTDGSIVKEFPDPEISGYFGGIAYSNGNIYLSNSITQKIFNVDANSGQMLQEIEFPYGNPYGLGILNNYLYVAAYISSTGSSKLYKYNLSQIAAGTEEIKLPEKYILYQNYPNPFNPTTTINYSVSKTSFVTIKIFDSLGREVTTLVNQEKTAGNYQISFDASKYATGVYYYRMQAGDFVETKKLVHLK